MRLRRSGWVVDLFNETLDEVMSLQQDSPIREALKREGFIDMGDLLGITQNDIEYHLYYDDGNGNKRQLSVDDRNMMHAFNMLVRNRIAAGSHIVKERNLDLTASEYFDYYNSHKFGTALNILFPAQNPATPYKQLTLFAKLAKEATIMLPRHSGNSHDIHMGRNYNSTNPRGTHTALDIDKGAIQYDERNLHEDLAKENVVRRDDSRSTKIELDMDSKLTHDDDTVHDRDSKSTNDVVLPNAVAAIMDGGYPKTQSDVLSNNDETTTITTIDEALATLRTQHPQTYEAVLASHFVDGNDQNTTFDGDPFSNAAISWHSNLVQLYSLKKHDRTTWTRMKSHNDGKYDDTSHGTLKITFPERSNQYKRDKWAPRTIDDRIRKLEILPSANTMGSHHILTSTLIAYMHAQTITMHYDQQAFSDTYTAYGSSRCNSGTLTTKVRSPADPTRAVDDNPAIMGSSSVIMAMTISCSEDTANSHKDNVTIGLCMGRSSKNTKVQQCFKRVCDIVPTDNDYKLSRFEVDSVDDDSAHNTTVSKGTGTNGTPEGNDVADGHDKLAMTSEALVLRLEQNKEDRRNIDDASNYASMKTFEVLEHVTDSIESNNGNGTINTVNGDDDDWPNRYHTKLHGAPELKHSHNGTIVEDSQELLMGGPSNETTTKSNDVDDDTVDNKHQELTADTIMEYIDTRIGSNYDTKDKTVNSLDTELRDCSKRNFGRTPNGAHTLEACEDSSSTKWYDHHIYNRNEGQTDAFDYDGLEHIFNHFILRIEEFLSCPEMTSSNMLLENSSLLVSDDDLETDNGDSLLSAELETVDGCFKYWHDLPHQMNDYVLGSYTGTPSEHYHSFMTNEPGDHDPARTHITTRIVSPWQGAELDTQPFWAFQQFDLHPITEDESCIHHNAHDKSSTIASEALTFSNPSIPQYSCEQNEDSIAKTEDWFDTDGYHEIERWLSHILFATDEFMSSPELTYPNLTLRDGNLMIYEDLECETDNDLGILRAELDAIDNCFHYFDQMVSPIDSYIMGSYLKAIFGLYQTRQYYGENCDIVSPCDHHVNRRTLWNTSAGSCNNLSHADHPIWTLDGPAMSKVADGDPTQPRKNKFDAHRSSLMELTSSRGVTGFIQEWSHGIQDSVP
jgi:hypothetical protein